MLRTLIGTTAMVIAIGLGGTAGSQAQEAGRSCVHDGRLYQPGQTVVVEGETLVCDGETGTWVPQEGSE